MSNMPNVLTDCDDLRGYMVDGYDADDVNRAFSRIHDACGLHLVCVWETFDAFGVGGNSDFYVEKDGRLHYLGGDLWQWLNGDPEDADVPITPGTPASWIGERADPTLDPDWDDGFHNLAIADREE
ncbi:hypothetical protein ACFXKF_36595 [Streptomyces scopuliridis]|uniref:hypothetical protein n=1 Tax=Streptomyces scopuliridis TaxID=452529 RepID=UPI003681AA0F